MLKREAEKEEAFKKNLYHKYFNFTSFATQVKLDKNANSGKYWSCGIVDRGLKFFEIFSEVERAFFRVVW